MVLKTDFHFLPLRLCLFSSPVTHQLHTTHSPTLSSCTVKMILHFSLITKCGNYQIYSTYFILCVFDWPKLPHSPMWEDLEGSSMPHTSSHHITYRVTYYLLKCNPPQNVPKNQSYFYHPSDFFDLQKLWHHPWYSWLTSKFKFCFSIWCSGDGN